MLVRLLKSHTFWNGTREKKLPVGKILTMANNRAKRLIENNEAEEYKGSFPPKKMKLNLKNLK
jgi:hypothetical protein